MGGEGGVFGPPRISDPRTAYHTMITRTSTPKHSLICWFLRWPRRDSRAGGIFASRSVVAFLMHLILSAPRTVRSNVLLYFPHGTNVLQMDAWNSVLVIFLEPLHPPHFLVLSRLWN